MLLPEGVTAVAAGSRHTLMLGESGDVWAVGSNSSGQLGLGPKFGGSSPAPRRVPALAGMFPLSSLRHNQPPPGCGSRLDGDLSASHLLECFAVGWKFWSQTL